MLELRWLLELRMQRYGQAAGTLARVCRAEGGDAQTFATAKRAACLAKLALLADQEGGLAHIQPKARNLQHEVHLQNAARSSCRCSLCGIWCGKGNKPVLCFNWAGPECTCDVQARDGIEEADASMCLLNVQSQLGLANKGPMPARTLAEAALQVAFSCPFRLDC